jgi:hypothetical protein
MVDRVLSESEQKEMLYGIKINTEYNEYMLRENKLSRE